ncbi:MAG TPA: L,D-transpeptidase family protein [Xanthobacteraceae bacterium]|nr:L,D-transpeptidase family protein [Xanthobacteraceae bacterium]
MSERQDSGVSRDFARRGKGFSRRRFLGRVVGVAAVTSAAGKALAQQLAQDQPLRTLMGETDRGEFGQSFDQASRTIHMPKATAPTLSAATAETTQQAVATYDAIVARGGWPIVPKVDELRLGNRHPSVVDLRTRLSVSGDLDPSAVGNDIYDSYVEEAVRRFQARHGLNIDGIVREATLDAMNVPATTRRDQLKINIERLKTLSTNLGPRYVVANIPAARVEAIQNDVVVSRHAAVAGKPDRPSPDINSKIIQINFNPYWTVPASIVRKDLIPKMQDEPDYLTENHIRILDGKQHELQPSDINWYSEDATNYTFKQDPGAKNSLGTIRINFPSAYGVYMHDTPLKNLFGDDFRFHSSGCMRVQNVRELVYWLLDETKGWSPDEIDRVIKSGERKDAQLAKPVPLHWVYVTAWSASDGVVQFREDIYGRDGLGAPAIPATTKL